MEYIYFYQQNKKLKQKYIKEEKNKCIYLFVCSCHSEIFKSKR